MKTTETAQYLGVSVNTLKAMTKRGDIQFHVTPGGHRRFVKAQLDSYLGIVPKEQFFDEDPITLIYARCSTAKQKENLERQKERLIEYAEKKGYKYQLIDEIASGINEKRKGIHKLIKLVMGGKVERILVEYEDRLARFGFEYILSMCRYSGVLVEVVNKKQQSYTEELAEDIMKILTCYSARFYGARGGRKKKKQEEGELTLPLLEGKD